MLPGLTSDGALGRAVVWACAAAIAAQERSDSKRSIIFAMILLWWRRIIQCKMILKRIRFPMQGDTERVGRRVGMLRRDVPTYAECREPEPRADPPVFATERRRRVCRPKPRRDLRLDRAGAGGARVRAA